MAMLSQVQIWLWRNLIEGVRIAKECIFRCIIQNAKRGSCRYALLAFAPSQM